MSGQQQHIEREQQQSRIDMQGHARDQIADIHQEEQDQLDAHLDEVGRQSGQRNHEPREIHLPEYGRVVDEHVGRHVERVAEVVPQHHAGQVEQNESLK